MSGPVEKAAVSMLAVGVRRLSETTVGAPREQTLVYRAHGRLRQRYCGGEEGGDPDVVFPSGEDGDHVSVLLCVWLWHSAVVRD